MKARKSLGKPIGKFDPIKFEKNMDKIKAALVSNLNANMIKDAANRKKK